MTFKQCASTHLLSPFLPLQVGFDVRLIFLHALVLFLTVRAPHSFVSAFHQPTSSSLLLYDIGFRDKSFQRLW